MNIPVRDRLSWFTSIKTRLVLSTLALFLVGFWSLEFYATRTLRQEMQDLLGAQQDSTTAFAAAEINDNVAERISALETVSRLITPSLLANPSALQSFLLERPLIMTHFNGGVFVMSTDGVAIVDSPVVDGRAGTSYMERAYAIGALRDGKPTVGSPLFGKALKSMLVTMAVPIRAPSGEIIGAIAGVTDLAKPNFLDTIGNNSFGQSGHFIVIAPERRLIVTASDKKRILEVLPAPGVNQSIDEFLNGAEGTRVMKGAAGEEVLVAVRRIPLANWIVATTLPTEEAFAPAEALARRVHFATGILTLVVGFFMWWFLRRELSPLSRTEAALSDLSKDPRTGASLPIVRNDEIGGLIASFNRLLARLDERQAAISHLAFYDQLTGLPNRRLLIDRLQEALTSSLERRTFGALFYIDLDNFKTINDTLGHATGDALLRQATARILDCIGPDHFAAGLGADNFAVIASDLGASLAVADEKARKVGYSLLETFRQNFEIGDFRCHVTASIGIALFGVPEDTYESLLKRVDLAMYQAKEAGRDTLRMFDMKMEEHVRENAQIEADLRIALDEGQFRLYYQPQFDAGRNIVGAEALLRWHHPERGVISPNTFIGLAERTGLILRIGQWVLDEACTQLGQWSKDPIMAGIPVAINVSAVQLYQPNFVRQTLDALKTAKVDPARLKIEITESMLLEGIESASSKLTALREHGVRFSLDDFGTGYSSLAYLNRLPIDQLKIDRSFVSGSTNDASARSITRSIIGLGKTLGLNVIAEGVETQEQLTFLVECGCTHYQGYLFGAPMPTADLMALVHANATVSQTSPGGQREWARQHGT